MRIGGLASGIDTESIINDMMRAHRIPLNKITQKKQYAEWQLDDYRSVNRDIRSMRDDLFDMTRQSTYMAKTVSVSNENAVSVRATSATSEFSGTLQVHQLATAATWQSDKQNYELDENKDIKEVFDFPEDQKEMTLKITAPGTKNGETVSDEIEINADDSIRSVVSKINKSNAGVNVFFDEHTGKIAMTAKNSGKGDIQVETAEVTSEDESKPKFRSFGEPNPGQNADFTFNGLRTERASNTFDINGFEITLKEVTAPYTGKAEEGKIRPVEDGGVVTFSSAPDVDKVFDSVKQFVDDYNDLIKELNDKLREQKYRDYHPLSAEEKAEMKEKEIELWEEKAMSGTLRNDPTIQSLLQNMRTTLNSSVTTSTGEKVRLSDLGITTTKDYLSNGKLEIDEDKLRKVISEDPNKVYELFGRAGDTTEETGLVTRMRTNLSDANKAITTRAGTVGSGNESSTLGRNIKEMDNQIERFEDRMQSIEERYWKQFSAMEQAMQRANAQAEQLMNALGGMGGMM